MWRVQNDTAAVGVGKGVYYTAKAGAVYAFAMDWPENGVPCASILVGVVAWARQLSARCFLAVNLQVLSLRMPVSSDDTTVTMLGCSSPLHWKRSGPTIPGLEVTMPEVIPTEIPSPTAPWVLKLTAIS